MAASASSPVKFKRTLSRRMDVAADAADDDLDAVVAPGAVYRLDDGAKGGAGGPRTSGVGGKAAAATRLSGGGGGSHTDGDEEPARPEPLPPRRRKGDRGRGKGWGCDEVFDPRGAIIAVDFHVAQQRVIRLNEVNSSCSVRHLKYLLDQARDNTRHFFHPGRLKLFSPEGREMTDNERAIGAYGIMDDEVMVTVEEVKHPHPGYCILEGATLDVLCPTGPPVRDQKAADLEARILKEEASSTDSDEEVAAMVAAERAKRAKQPPPRVVRSYRDVPWAVELVDDLLLFETQLRRAGGRPLGKQVPGGTEPRALRTCVARLAAEMAQLASLDRIPCNAELWVDTDKWHDHQTGLTLGARLEAPPGHYEGQVHWLQIRIPERYPYVPYWAQFKSEILHPAFIYDFAAMAVHQPIVRFQFMRPTGKLGEEGWRAPHGYSIWHLLQAIETVLKQPRDFAKMAEKSCSICYAEGAKYRVTEPTFLSRARAIAAPDPESDSDSDF